MDVVHLYSKYVSVGFETFSTREEDLKRLDQISNIGKFRLLPYIVSQELDDSGVVAIDFINSIEFLDFIELCESNSVSQVILSDPIVLNSIRTYLKVVGNNVFRLDIGDDRFITIYYLNMMTTSDEDLLLLVDRLGADRLYENPDLAIKDKNMMHASSFLEYENFIETYVSDVDTIAFDIETNAQDRYSKDIEIVGFSMAVSPEIGIYVSRKSLEVSMSDSDWESVVGKTKEVLSDKTVIVHNCMYEVPVLVNCWDYEIKDYLDTMIKSRIMLGATTGASLKFQCQSNLGYPDWETDLSLYLDSLELILSSMRPTPRGNSRYEFTELKKESSLVSVRDTIRAYDNMLSDDVLLDMYSNPDNYDSRLSREQRILVGILNLGVLIGKYYPSEEDEVNIWRSLSDTVISLVDSGFSTLSYGLVPFNIISRYGALDSLGTYELNSYLDSKMKETSKELDIDLFRGYKYLENQFKAAIWMEMNGIYYDHDTSLDVEEWHLEARLKYSRILYTSPHMRDYLIDSSKEFILRDYIKEDPYRISEFTREKFEVQKTGVRFQEYGRVAFGRMYEYLQHLVKCNIISDSYILEKVSNLVFDKIESASDYEEFKYLFNVGSSTKTVVSLFDSIMVTDSIKVADFYRYIHVYITDNDFHLDTLNVVESKLAKLLIDYTKYQTKDLSDEEYEFGEEFKSIETPDNTSVFEVFNSLMPDSVSEFQDTYYIESYKSAMKYAVENNTESTLVDLYDLYRIKGLDIDSPDTWDDRFTCIYSIRVIKKCNKILSTYINGARVGRGQVYLVDRSKIEDKDTMLAPRKLRYENIESIEDSECLIMQPSYSPCSTETFRWRSGMHTLPADSSVMNVFRSRFKGGVIIAPDFCLVGDTKIKLADGTNTPIKDLVSRDEFYVYSYDKDSNKYVIGRGHDCRLVRYTDDLVRFSTSSGNIYECTPEHQWLSYSGEWVHANNLFKDFSLRHVEFVRRYNARRDRLCIVQPDKSEDLLHYLADDYNIANNRYSDSYPTEKFDRHHLDGDIDNNSPNNIERWTKSAHLSYHAKEQWSDSETLYDGKTYKELMTEVGNNNADMFREFNHNKEYIELRKNGREESSNNKFLKGLKLMSDTHSLRIVLRDYNYQKYYDSEVAKLLGKKRVPKGYGLRTITDRDKSLYNIIVDNIDYLVSDELDKDSILEDLSLINKYQSIDSRLTTKINNLYQLCESNNLSTDDWDSSIDKLKELGLVSQYHGVRYSKVINLFDSELNFRKYCRNNSYVTRIEFLKVDQVPTYCFTVDDYHNFIVGDSPMLGEVTHNSQMEVRALAGASECQPMIDAFNDGVDIHTWNASAIWGVPEEEVTVSQRRFSKMATFSILYGQTPEGFGKGFLYGDITLANEIYDRFYNAFPEVGEFIKAKHEEMLTTHKVITPANLFLAIDPNECRGGVEEAKRRSQNYPIQSISSDTVVNSLDFSSKLTIGDIVSKGITSIYTLACDPETQEIIPVKGISAQCTGTTDTWYKLTLDNGESVKVTPDHQMMLRDGTFKRADELEIGQSLMPGYIFYDRGYPYIKSNNSSDNMSIHDLVYDEFGYVSISDMDYPNIHHIDMNRLNNNPSNLVEIPSSLHSKYHRTLEEYKYRGELDSENLDALLDFMRSSLKPYYSSQDITEIISSMKEFHEKLILDSSTISSNSMSRKNSIRSEEYQDWDYNQREAVSKEVNSRYEKHGSVLGDFTHEELSKIHKEKVWGVHRDRIVESLKQGHNTEEAKLNHSNASKKRESDPDYVFNRVKKQILEMYELGLPYNTPEEWDDGKDKLVKVNKFSRRASSYILKYYTWDEFVSKCDELTVTHNHKVKSIEVIKLDIPEPKYDLHIPYYENFLLDCGVFTHNSAGTTMGGNVVYEIMKYIKSNDLLSRVILFVHDSIEVDIHPAEFISIGSQIIPLMNEYPLKEFGVPSKADLTVGISLGQQLEVTKIQASDDYTEAELEVEGLEEDFDLVVSQFNKSGVFDIVEWSDLSEPEDQYTSYGDIFIPKSAIKVHMGSTRKTIKRELKLKLKDK